VYIRIVTFRIEGLTEDQYVAAAGAAAPGFAAWPGLVAKYWLADRTSGTYGGVYVFEDEAAADRSRSTPEFAGLGTNPHVVDLDVRELPTIEALDAVTAAGRRTSSPT
jgi:putative monooxygenase ydhR